MEIEKMAALFEAVKVLKIRPNDILVFRTPAILSTDQAEQLRATLKQEIPNNRIIILPGGMDLMFVRQDEPQPVNSLTMPDNYR